MSRVFANIKNNAKLYQLILLALLSFVLVILFRNSRYFESVQLFAEDNRIAIVIVLIFAKILAIVWPPFPATIFILGLMPIVGFWPAFLADYIGEIIGSCIAYFIAYKYGYKGISLFLDEKSIKKIERIKVREGRELEFLLILRILGNTFFELVCFAAGLLRVDFKAFLISTIVSYFIVSIVIFKLVEGLLGGGSFYINAVPILILVLFIWKFSPRYIRFDD